MSMLYAKKSHRELAHFWRTAKLLSDLKNHDIIIGKYVDRMEIDYEVGRQCS